MRYDGLDQFLSDGRNTVANGPLALVFVEDNIEVDSTLRHTIQAGFSSVIAFMPSNYDLPLDLQEAVVRVDFDANKDQAVEDAINQVIDIADNQWIYYCYNAEYLFYPFCETRSINEMLTFHSEERRDAMLAYVIDLYADDLDKHPNAVSLSDAHFDRAGYYALARTDPAVGNAQLERQQDFFGGLRWRFEEHVPASKRKIDRIALFRAKKGLRMLDGHIFNDQEYNTYSCPWHHNLTAAICSFRTAKALKTNPGSKTEIRSFNWHNSTSFEWHSEQLMKLGLMEPGQWL